VSARYLELVCPAGTPAALRAAVDAGADAVYCGFRDCTNARNYPGLNFDPDELREGITHARGHGCKVLVAINTFPRAGDVGPWHRAVDEAAAAANAPSIAFYRENFDIKRVVLSRVLSVEEVTALIAEIGIETEVFAFGSVGPMSEGRCFLSSYLTGLSPTSEGACAPASHVTYLEKDGRVLSTLGQVTLNSFARGEPAAYPTPCKGRYVTHGRASYLFEEPVALNAISILPELKAAGVTALKIEGRQRSRAYVTQIVGTFRRALDALARGDSASTAIGQLKAEAEGGRETFGAYHKGWR
jgi:putative protease